jgi:hypothetical protein
MYATTMLESPPPKGSNKEYMEKLLVPSYVVEVEGFFVNHRAMPQIIHM